jgi:hypothetical protein
VSIASGWSAAIAPASAASSLASSSGVSPQSTNASAASALTRGIAQSTA